MPDYIILSLQSSINLKSIYAYASLENQINVNKIIILINVKFLLLVSKPI